MELTNKALSLTFSQSVLPSKVKHHSLRTKRCVGFVKGRHRIGIVVALRHTKQVYYRMKDIGKVLVVLYAGSNNMA